eukprot:g450.t1
MCDNLYQKKKKRIVTSDDSDSEQDIKDKCEMTSSNAIFVEKSDTLRKKRRIVVSDDEGEDDDGHEREKSTAFQDVIVIDSDEEPLARKKHRKQIDDKGDDEEEENYEEEDEEEWEEEEAGGGMEDAAVDEESSDSDSSEDSTPLFAKALQQKIDTQSLDSKFPGRSFCKLTASQRLGALKTLLVEGTKIKANRQCPLLGSELFRVVGITPRSIVLEGKAKQKQKGKVKGPSKLVKMSYRIDWRRLDKFCLDGKWSVEAGRGKVDISMDEPLPSLSLAKAHSMYAAAVLRAIETPGTTWRNVRRGQVRDEVLARWAHSQPRDILRQTIKGKTTTSSSLSSSKDVGPANFRSLSSADLRHLYSLYDRHFFDSQLQIVLQRSPTGPKRGLKFQISKRMTKTGGLCVDRRHKHAQDILIKISGPILLGLPFPGVTVRAQGIECKDRLEALMVVFEHELAHAILQSVCPKHDYAFHGGHTHAFRWFVECLFGHTSCTHELLKGDVHEHDKKTKKLADAGKQLKRRLRPGTSLYVLHDKGGKQLFAWAYKASQLPSAWKGESYVVLKKNPKRVVVAACKNQQEAARFQKLSCNTLLTQRHNQIRFTMPYAWLASKQVGET